MAAPEACVKSFQRRLFRVFVADSGVSIVELKQVNINCVQECSKASWTLIIFSKIFWTFLKSP